MTSTGTSYTDSNGKAVAVAERLDELRELIAKGPYLMLRMDDSYLMRYLCSDDFNAREAYERMKIINTFRIDYPEFFCHSPPESFQKYMDWHVKAILEGTDREGRRIYLCKMQGIGNATINEMCNFDELWIESVADEPETQKNGISCILDMAGYSWKLLKWLTPRNIRISTKISQKYPLKSICFHVINSSMLLNASVALIFPFLDAEFKSNVHFHYQNWPSLHEFIDPEYLPREYGGRRCMPNFNEQNRWLQEQFPRLTENFKRDNRL